MASELTRTDYERIDQFLRIPSDRRRASLLSPRFDDERQALADDE